MRTTDLHFRSPRASNSSYTFYPNILNNQSKRTAHFLKDTRFAHGSIYQNQS